MGLKKRIGFLLLGSGNQQTSISSKVGSSRTPLPQELLQSIFAELDDESVRQCALAARSLLEPARSRLFRTLVLREEDDLPPQANKSKKVKRWLGPRSTKSQRLAALLKSASQLGEYAKALIFEGLPYSLLGRPWYRSDEVAFHLILPRLPNLQSISFLFHQQNPLPFFCVPAPSCAAIIRSLHSPKIRKIIVENVSFDNADNLVVFLKHVASGGGLEELSVTTWANEPIEARWHFHQDWWNDVPIHHRPYALRSLRVNGPPRVIQKVLGWARRDANLSLDNLSRFEVVGAITPGTLNLVESVIGSDSLCLRHLGITAGEEPFRSSFPSTQSSASSLTQALRSGIAYNLRVITFYAIAFMKMEGHSPSPVACLDWWCNFLDGVSLPNLSEFRVDRRGYCSYYLISPEDVIDMGSYRVLPEMWQNLELILARSAPNSTLCIDIEASGWAKTVHSWKEEYFPTGDYSYLECCFPSAHSGRIPLIFNLTIRVRHFRSRRWLLRSFAKPRRSYERGNYAYTPERRWTRLDYELHDSQDTNASRSDFEYFLED
ncbi:hypothetical protein AAF712_013828 [Marasmius tenuissimus]|uniref:F-box domain-containing protein n=1 Tax=Marasmius tenuissimus TaxID=585030 RepID=A0ABR2ZDN5_9AGAR